VDFKSIYNGNFNILPPPNSPWAALDGDFGLELTGFMSRMAELPDERYIFDFIRMTPGGLTVPGWIVTDANRTISICRWLLPASTTKEKSNYLPI